MWHYVLVFDFVGHTIVLHVVVCFFLFFYVGGYLQAFVLANQNECGASWVVGGWAGGGDNLGKM